MSMLVQEKGKWGRIQNKVMIKTKFYGKSITLVNDSGSITFTFCRTDQKKRAFKK